MNILFYSMMRVFNKPFFLFFYLLFFVCADYPAFAKTPIELIESGVQQKELNYKIMFFTQAIEASDSDPDSRALGYYNRGVAYYEQKLFDKALADFEACLDLRPNDIDALLNAGLTLKVLKQPDKAIEKFDTIISLFPESTLGYFNRGNIHLNRRERYKAIDDYSKALELSPFHVDALNNRGWAYFFTKQNSKALEDFNKVLTIDPNDSFAQEGISQIHKILDKS